MPSLLRQDPYGLENFRVAYSANKKGRWRLMADARKSILSLQVTVLVRNTQNLYSKKLLNSKHMTEIQKENYCTFEIFKDSSNYVTVSAARENRNGQEKHLFMWSRLEEVFSIELNNDLKVVELHAKMKKKYTDTLNVVPTKL